MLDWESDDTLHHSEVGDLTWVLEAAEEESPVVALLVGAAAVGDAVDLYEDPVFRLDDVANRPPRLVEV